jgi:hypothetical protein
VVVDGCRAIVDGRLLCIHAGTILRSTLTATLRESIVVERRVIDV